MRHGRSQKERDLHLNGGAILEDTSSDIKTFCCDSVGMECEAGFLSRSRVQRQGREYQCKLERIGKAHDRDRTYEGDSGELEQGSQGFLSLSGAMLLGSLASS